MRIPRLYVNQILTENSTIILEQEVFHYIVNVLRVKAGRELRLFNGLLLDGLNGEYQCSLLQVNKKSATVQIGQFVQKETESPLKVELGCCLIKNDRMDWLLQKATELGVHTFSPLISSYVDVKIPVDRLSKKMQHWQQVIVSACEQSGRVQIPVVNIPVDFSTWIKSVEAESKKILHPYNAMSFGVTTKPTTLALAVGPEGGLTDAEVALAHENEFDSMLLGPRILRAETAPLAALSIIQNSVGDI